MDAGARDDAHQIDWHSFAMVLTMPMAIAAVSFGCQFFL
ncbi:hypothetical protein FHX09_001224 [Rhizobium sp. BK538]|nr:hypothetical protein [Rhizobium sp. BK060]MBB4167393.1 hypothetical protein [Rhizobium sp. BK538]TCM63865.1 hypothetical protein EV291_14711 [Rhizobium sp. BK068]